METKYSPDNGMAIGVVFEIGGGEFELHIPKGDMMHKFPLPFEGMSLEEACDSVRHVIVDLILSDMYFTMKQRASKSKEDH